MHVYSYLTSKPIAMPDLAVNSGELFINCISLSTASEQQRLSPPNHLESAVEPFGKTQLCNGHISM